MSALQGIVIGTGENSEFGEVFKMMQAEEVKILQTFYIFIFFLAGIKSRSQSSAQPMEPRLGHIAQT